MEAKKNNLNHDISIIDTPTSPNIDTSEANLIPTSIEELEAMDYEKRHLDTQKRSFNALRVEKAVATRKARTKYKKNVQGAVQALLNGTYCALTDGTEITGAEMVAINLFERSLYKDESAKLLLKVSGDLNANEAEETSYEEFIKDVTPTF
jgi:hypothetical protein